MKLLLCFAFLFLLTNSSFIDLSGLAEDLNQEHCHRDRYPDLAIFIESTFSHFGLEKPTQVLTCFNSESAELFFKNLWTVKKLIEDSRERKGFAAHLDFLKLELIDEGLSTTYGCIMMTEDFTKLLDALKIDERNPQLFGMTLYLYYQSFYPRLINDIQPLIDTFKAKDYSQAGEIFGGLLECMVNEIREDGFAYLAFSAFSNGVSAELDIPFPKDSVKCHNEDSAMAILKFLYKLSVKVDEGGVKEAPLSTLNFWNDEGKAILDTISDDVVKCSMNSQDIALLSRRLGIRVGSEGFGEALKRYITRRRLSYFVSMKGLRSSTEDHNFVHAGYSFGHLLDHLARSLPYEEKTETLAQ